MIKANDIQLLSVLFNKCVWAEKDYMTPTQQTFLEWYNNASGRDICIRTFNYMMRRLEDGKYIIRSRRKWPNAENNFWFRSTMYQWTMKGKMILERFGVKCIEVLYEIKDLMNGINEKPLSAATQKGFEAKSGPHINRLSYLVSKIKTI